jgi:uncharacterized protein YbjT (DUF2867 family)
MEKILLFGATGNLGKEIARYAVNAGYDVTAVVRDQIRAGVMAGIVPHTIVANIMGDLTGICKEYDIVISALGKSVSLNDRSKAGFKEIDYNANKKIVEDAVREGVKKFVYVSALHAEDYPHLNYFKTHHDLSELLIRSGLNYSIIKPPAIFSSFKDLAQMAAKGRLMNMGSGDKQTNPIYEGDLAAICVESIKSNNTAIPAGGKEIFTRKQINELIQQTINPRGKVRSMPLGLMKLTLPLIKIFDKNTYDKFAFYLAVMETDIIAPQIGETKLADYLETMNF